MAGEQIIGVYADGSQLGPSVPANPRTTLSVQKGMALDVDVLVINSAGAPVDLATIDTLAFTVRKNPEPLVGALPLISRRVTVPAGSARGRGLLSLVTADTINLSPGRYVWDLHAKFTVDGKWRTLVGLSAFHVEPSAGNPNAPPA